MASYPIHSTPSGRIAVFVYNFKDNTFRRLVKPYYVSNKDRLCFKHGPGLDQGMKRKRLGQFELDGDYAFMYTLDLQDQDYYKDTAHFMRCVLKTIARRKNLTNP